MIKKLFIGAGIVFLVLGVITGILIYWASHFSPDEQEMKKLNATRVESIDYLQNALPKNRGKILAVVTSIRALANTGRPTGYELTELARAYWVFQVNGFEVDIASPEGGEPYALLDDEDMGSYDYAFLNDATAQYKMKNTLKLEEINADNYQAVYFVGGKGAMFDFPSNPVISTLVTHFVAQHKVIAAVCHGPAALVNVKTANGEWLVANKKISAFTNSEELLLIPNAETIFPFLLQTKLEARGANFIAGADYLEQVSVDKGLVTGQNPWSVWRLAEETVKSLGYEPVSRTLTPEENSVTLLKVYHKDGLDVAEKITRNHKHNYNGRLILMHAFVEFMKWELLNGFQLMILADGLKPVEA